MQAAIQATAFGPIIWIKVGIRQPAELPMQISARTIAGIATIEAGGPALRKPSMMSRASQGRPAINAGSVRFKGPLEKGASSDGRVASRAKHSQRNQRYSRRKTMPGWWRCYDRNRHASQPVLLVRETRPIPPSSAGFFIVKPITRLTMHGTVGAHRAISLIATETTS